MLSPQQAASQPALNAPDRARRWPCRCNGGFGVPQDARPDGCAPACCRISRSGCEARSGDGVGGDDEQIVPMHAAERHLGVTATYPKHLAATEEILAARRLAAAWRIPGGRTR
jgi:hypothetical protein